jgi:exopolysaccharide production protein ExoZ
MILVERAKSVFVLKPASQHELVGVQYVRAAAALIVVLDHVSEMMGEPKYFGRQPFDAVLASGAVGVDLFFCLSGFIIVYIGVNAAWAPTMGAWVFFKRRFARIVPFMWAAIAGYALLRVVGRGGDFPAVDYARAAVLWPFGPVEPGPVWTLRHEFLFYGVFALTFLSGRRWLLGLWAVSPLALAAIQALFGPYVGIGPDIAWFLFNPIDMLFGLGVCFGLAYVRWRPVWPAGAWAAPATVAGCAGVFGLALALHYDRSLPWMVAVIGLASCACLAAACAVLPPRGFIGDLGRRLGDASYCIYLIHTAFVSAVLGLISHRAPGLPDAVIVAVTFLIAVGSGLVLHYVVERPIVAWSQRLIFPKRIEGR